MAITITKGFTWSNGATVMPTRLNLAQEGLVINLADDKLLGRATAGAGPVEEIACTAAGRAMIAATDVAAQRTVLSVPETGTVLLKASNLTDLTDKAAARAALGVGETRVRATAQLNKTNDTTLADIPGMAVTVTSGVTYTLESWLSYLNGTHTDQSSGLLITTLSHMLLTGTATVSALNGIIVTGSIGATGTAFPLDLGGLSGGGTVISITFTCSGAGTLKWQFAQNTASADTNSARLGSYMRLFAY